MTKGKIAMALSGGVDSGVAGALLLEEGWSVIGVTLQMHDPAVLGGIVQDKLDAAKAIALKLGIQHFILNCVSDFERLVLRPAWNEYASGRTPCPCMWCNERVKFDIMLNWALENGCQALATGHYVKLRRDGDQVVMLRGDDRNKDQTYFLSGATQKQLSRLVFPLGDKDKPWVRKKAAELGLPCAQRAESQDSCFIFPGLSLSESLKSRFGDAETQKCGFIVDWNGNKLARHGGIHNFTIGQRRGVKVGTGARAWVRDLDVSTGDVYLTNDEDDLLRDEITVSGLIWTSLEPPAAPLECEVQIRYRGAPVQATLVEISDDRGRLVLHKPTRAVAPGQAAAFYDGDRVLGRGWINSVFRHQLFQS